MAGSACRFFAPRISAALGGGRERRRSAPGPARTPPARPPCRARGTPARRSAPGAGQRGRGAGTPRGRHPPAPPAPARCRSPGSAEAAFNRHGLGEGF